MKTPFLYPMVRSTTTKSLLSSQASQNQRERSDDLFTSAAYLYLYILSRRSDTSITGIVEILSTLSPAGEDETLHQVPVCPGPICPYHLRLSGQVPKAQQPLLPWSRQVHPAQVPQCEEPAAKRGQGVRRRAPCVLSELHKVPGWSWDGEERSLRTPLEADIPPLPPLSHRVRFAFTEGLAVTGFLWITAHWVSMSTKSFQVWILVPVNSHGPYLFGFCCSAATTLSVIRRRCKRTLNGCWPSSNWRKTSSSPLHLKTCLPMIVCHTGMEEFPWRTGGSCTRSTSQTSNSSATQSLKIYFKMKRNVWCFVVNQWLLESNYNFPVRLINNCLMLLIEVFLLENEW